MLFNSIPFFIFLFAVALCYFSIPHRFRIWFLLAASYYFYMCWHWEYIFLILGQTAIHYVCGRNIGASRRPTHRKAWLTVSVLSALGMLFFFKYYNFANDSAKALFRAAGVPYLVPHLDFLLPVGISFYTFQAMSYVIDVYRNDCAVERYFGRFALFVSFFPQLVAGPIERAGNLIEQFKEHHRFDIVRFTDGLKLILWGLFKKVVIADRLAVYVDRVYATPDYYSGITLAVATYFFAFQIYCDFSGYSDIAIGSARMLGYNLMQNFRLPYLATSIPDFWQRWHISLSTWFRDYVYFPLGGSRVSAARWTRNILIVFLVSGLWHGANWTFIAWGGLHGTFYLLGGFFRRAWRNIFPQNERLSAMFKPLKILLTFHLVAFAWIFFRAASLGDAWLIATRILTQPVGSLYMGPSTLTTALSVLLILFLVSVQLLQYGGRISLYFSTARMPVQLRWAGYLTLVLGIMLLGKSSNEFIYFQF